MTDATSPTARLIAATRALVDSVSFDVNGAMIAGQYRGGNGGLVSRETITRADEARRAIAAIEASPPEAGHGAEA